MEIIQKPEIVELTVNGITVDAVTVCCSQFYGNFSIPAPDSGCKCGTDSIG